MRHVIARRAARPPHRARRLARRVGRRELGSARGARRRAVRAERRRRPHDELGADRVALLQDVRRSRGDREGPRTYRVRGADRFVSSFVVRHIACVVPTVSCCRSSSRKGPRTHRVRGADRPFHAVVRRSSSRTERAHGEGGGEGGDEGGAYDAPTSQMLVLGCSPSLVSHVGALAFLGTMRPCCAPCDDVPVAGFGRFLGYCYCSADEGAGADAQASTSTPMPAGLWGTWEIVHGQVQQELRDGGVFRLIPV